MANDSPFYLEARRGDDHIMKYDIYRAGEDKICTVYSHNYARRIIDVLNEDYKIRVAKMLLGGVTEKPDQST
jgi:hypothetical protein